MPTYFPKLMTLSPEEISRFLNRRRRSKEFDFEIRFDELFKDILMTANEFVPSEAGSILLDDPMEKSKETPSKRLVFIACFGDKAHQLIGKTLDGSVGIAGKTYHTGMAFKSEQVLTDKDYFPGVDAEINHKTRSIVSVPIIIEKSVCGVLELVNRIDGDNYTDREMELLKIFADYISTSIQNALETKRSKELTKLDDLTGLHNDRYFHYALEQCILKIGVEHDDLSLMFLDLDRFKEVNDQHGHLAGSRTLTEVGVLLRRTVRKKNAVLCRYGGDEFVCILPDVSINETREIAENVRTTIQKHVFLRTKSESGEPALSIKGVVTASIGVASFREHCRAPGGIKELQNQLISLADKAMYKAKEKGRNCVQMAGQ